VCVRACVCVVLVRVCVYAYLCVFVCVRVHAYTRMQIEVGQWPFLANIRGTVRQDTVRQDKSCTRYAIN